MSWVPFVILHRSQARQRLLTLFEPPFALLLICSTCKGTSWASQYAHLRLHFSSKYSRKKFVVDGIKIPGDIPFNEPPCSRPLLLYFRQGTVTATSRSEAMRARTELRFVIRFQYAPQDFLKQLVRPCGYS